MSFGVDRTPFEELGGEVPVRALVDRFYDEMDRDPAYAGIRAMHPPSLDDARDKLYWFLSGWLGGPALYVERFGHPKLRGRHMHVAIDESARDQWTTCMAVVMDAQEISGELRSFLDGRFAHVADFMRNQPATAG